MPFLEMIDIVKRYPGVVANDHVDLSVERGEIHAVMGENGAGKSTLMAILYGLQQPDEGYIKLDGTTAFFRSPIDAIERGIGMVHQSFKLFESLDGLGKHRLSPRAETRSVHRRRRGPPSSRRAERTPCDADRPRCPRRRPLPSAYGSAWRF